MQYTASHIILNLDIDTDRSIDLLMEDRELAEHIRNDSMNGDNDVTEVEVDRYIQALDREIHTQALEQMEADLAGINRHLETLPLNSILAFELGEIGTSYEREIDETRKKLEALGPR